MGAWRKTDLCLGTESESGNGLRVVMRDPWEDVLNVGLQARQALDRSDNDFTWSGWDGPDAALGEVDEVVAGLRHREPKSVRALQVLLITTGPICEVAMSSGWGKHWSKLAARCDKAILALPT